MKMNNTKELASARNAFAKEKFDVAIAKAKPFLDSAISDIKLEAAALTGLANFQKKEFEKAQSCFQMVVESSHKAEDWFNLLTSSTMAGDFATAQVAFQKTVEYRKAGEDPEEISIPFIIFYYACALRDKKKWDTALEQIEELRKIYEQLAITDDTFVSIRGVPFLSDTLQVALDVFRGLGDKFNADKWLNSFAKKLDADGKTLVQEYRQKLKVGV
ncbi:MAG: hypothetical protein WA821_21360 [Anaerolineales bacterium]